MGNHKGYHEAMAHEVGFIAVDGEVVPPLNEHADALGLVLVVVGDVEFVFPGAVGMEMVGAGLEAHDDFVLGAYLPPDAVKGDVESRGKGVVGLGVGTDAVVGHLEH